MKSLRTALSFLFILAATFAAAQTNAQKSFDQMKSLAGSWEGKNSQGQDLRVTFRSTAGDSALMSEIEGEGKDHDMISMIHLDGSRLVLTHYCSAGNQPRMQATASPEGKSVTFEFFDGTNLEDANAGHSHGHMQRVVFTEIDANHHTEDWTFNAGGGKEMKEFFDLHRAEVAKK